MEKEDKSDYYEDIYNENDQKSNKPEELYDFISKNRDFEKEIKNSLDEINNLMETEINRIFNLYSEMILDEKNTLKLKNILKCLFGTKESEKKYEDFLRFLHENKVIFTIL